MIWIIWVFAWIFLGWTLRRITLGSSLLWYNIRLFWTLKRYHSCEAMRSFIFFIKGIFYDWIELQIKLFYGLLSLFWDVMIRKFICIYLACCMKESRSNLSLFWRASCMAVKNSSWIHWKVPNLIEVMTELHTLLIFSLRSVA